MKTKELTEVLERIEAWPPEAQNELADIARGLDAGLSNGENRRRRKNSPASAGCATYCDVRLHRRADDLAGPH
jgi:hypothetical protein